MDDFTLEDQYLQRLGEDEEHGPKKEGLGKRKREYF